MLLTETGIKVFDLIIYLCKDTNKYYIMATMSKAAARRKDKLSKKINKANIKGKTKRATRLAKKASKDCKDG